MTPHMIETVHIPEEEYNGDTIVVTQSIRQRQEAASSPVSPPVHVSREE
jgi:hypothetical protein